MTRDGGRTWSSPALVGQPAYSLDSSPRLHVRFAGADGWAFGPGIYGSHDSGRTWHLQDERPILALEATANSAWAVVGCIRAHPCVPHLVVSSPGSDTWTDAPVQPGAAAAGDAMLERPTARTAFLVTLANDSKAYSGGSQLFVTRDGGHTWNGSPSPCDEIRQVRSLDGSLVWILCASQPGAGSQPKAVYVSRDGGRTWDLRAQSAFPSPVGDIGLGGYAASLVVTSPTTGLIGLLRGSVRVSSDQGRTWHPPAGDVLGGDAGAGVEELWFVDRNHGWALGGVGLAGPPLWMTSDGGYHWGPAGRPLDTSNLS